MALRLIVIVTVKILRISAVTFICGAVFDEPAATVVRVSTFTETEISLRFESFVVTVAVALLQIGVPLVPISL